MPTVWDVVTPKWHHYKDVVDGFPYIYAMRAVDVPATYIIQIKIFAGYQGMVPNVKAGLSGTWSKADRPKASGPFY